MACNQIHNFEKVEKVEFMLKGLTNNHSKILLPALYMVLGVETLRFTWPARKIMYLHTILTRDESELTNKIYTAQKEDTIDGDFFKLVSKDMEMIESILIKIKVIIPGCTDANILRQRKLKERTEI